MLRRRRGAPSASRLWRPVAAGVAMLLVAVAFVVLHRSRHVEVGLDQVALGIAADGSRVPLTAGDLGRFEPGTRVLRAGPGDDASAVRRLAERQRAWLAAADTRGVPPRMLPAVRTALLDLNTLEVAPGAVVAGPSPGWRYVWVRDGAFVAVALARVGHTGDASRLLLWLARQQGVDGSFHARYRPDGSGPPDGRGLQEDGPGWFLWAAREVLDAVPAGERARVRAALDPALARCVARLLDRLDPVTLLPEPSSDYWEVRESRTTLAVAATALAGLDSAVALDVRPDGRDVAAAAGALRAGLERAFGTRGYPRYAQGRGAADADSAVAMLLPPLQVRAPAGAAAALTDAVVRLRRPAGGLAPGEGWKDDGISWTPETALMALALMSAGEGRAARSLVDWLDAHRTRAGAYPEKVLHDGRPAAVAPLAWTCALVVVLATEPDAGRVLG